MNTRADDTKKAVEDEEEMEKCQERREHAYKKYLFK